MIYPQLQKVHNEDSKPSIPMHLNENLVTHSIDEYAMKLLEKYHPMHEKPSPLMTPPRSRSNCDVNTRRTLQAGERAHPSNVGSDRKVVHQSLI